MWFYLLGTSLALTAEHTPPLLSKGDNGQLFDQNGIIKEQFSADPEAHSYFICILSTIL